MSFRKQTTPGLAPPAPGSAPTPLQALQLADLNWDDDELPTNPAAQQPELLQLVRIVDAMPTVERRRFISLSDNYGKCSLDDRVLLEELARSLARKASHR